MEEELGLEGGAGGGEAGGREAGGEYPIGFSIGNRGTPAVSHTREAPENNILLSSPPGITAF